MEWRGRLEEQLGVYTVELADATAARVLDDELSLAGVNALASLLQVLPERDPHPQLYEAAVLCLRAAGHPSFTVSIIRFELRLLDELGFGLLLSKCAVTGGTEDLAYVSPKSGQAVMREAAGPYIDKLLPLPAFLSGGGDGGEGRPTTSDALAALSLTGYFLGRHVFDDISRPLPRAREEFKRILGRKGI